MFARGLYPLLCILNRLKAPWLLGLTPLDEERDFS